MIEMMLRTFIFIRNIPRVAKKRIFSQFLSCQNHLNLLKVSPVAPVAQLDRATDF